MAELSLGTAIIKTKAQVSIDEFGADYTGGSTEEFLVYEVIWSPLVLGTATCAANTEGCPVGEEYEYTSIEFEFQVFGDVTETPTMPNVPALTSTGDVAWFSETHTTVAGTKVMNPQTVSYNNSSLPVVKYIVIAASGLTNPLISNYVVGRFHLQIAAGNEGSSITTVIGASRRTLSMTSGSRNYMSALTAMDDNAVYTIPWVAWETPYVETIQYPTDTSYKYDYFTYADAPEGSNFEVSLTCNESTTDSWITQQFIIIYSLTNDATLAVLGENPYDSSTDAQDVNLISNYGGIPGAAITGTILSFNLPNGHSSGFRVQVYHYGLASCESTSMVKFKIREIDPNA